jgi:N-acetylmuramoyl-L-alanine amidase
LREAIPTTVFIEVANIQNAQDRKRIVLPQNRQFLAEWLAEGLLKDY